MLSAASATGSFASVDEVVVSTGDLFLLDNTLINGVPEPTTWAMLGLGFAGLGLVANRGRRTAIRMASDT